MKGLDYREAEELSWCPSWSNCLWQGWSCGLVHCPGGNATDLIWRVLASSDGISSWTPLKPQHSNPNPNPLANLLWCIDFLTPPIPLIIPHRLPAFLESLMPLKTDARFMQDAPKAVWSIPYVSVVFFQSLKQFYRISFTSCANQAFVGCISIPAVAVDLNLKSWKLVSHLIRCIAITYWILKSLRQF